MDPDYQQFSSPDACSVSFQPRVTPRIGVKRLLTFVPHAAVLLLLLILLMVTGIKFSQLNKEVRDIRVHLETMSHRGPSGSTPGGAPKFNYVYLERLKPVKGGCREGWVSFKTSCYLLSNNLITWSQAEKQCETHGAHLLVPNDEEELDFISRIVEIQNNYWMGLVERQHEGQWSWVDGTDYSTSQKFWDEGQPDNWDRQENGEDCGQIHSSGKRIRKLWNDADCQLQYRYICEARA